MVKRKCFIPQLYQFRRGMSGGQALKYFYMIHRGRLTQPIPFGIFESSFNTHRRVEC